MTDWSDDDSVVRMLVDGTPAEFRDAFEVASREQLAEAFVGVCQRMGEAMDDYERAETERVLRDWGIS